MFSPVVYELMAGLKPSNVMSEVSYIDDTVKSNVLTVCR